jgi:hypothetical protein
MGVCRPFLGRIAVIFFRSPDGGNESEIAIEERLL